MSRYNFRVKDDENYKTTYFINLLKGILVSLLTGTLWGITISSALLLMMIPEKYSIEMMVYLFPLWLGWTVAVGVFTIRFFTDRLWEFDN